MVNLSFDDVRVVSSFGWRVSRGVDSGAVFFLALFSLFWLSVLVAYCRGPLTAETQFGAVSWSGCSAQSGLLHGDL